MGCIVYWDMQKAVLDSLGFWPRCSARFVQYQNMRWLIPRRQWMKPLSATQLEVWILSSHRQVISLGQVLYWKETILVWDFARIVEELGHIWPGGVFAQGLYWQNWQEGFSQVRICSSGLFVQAHKAGTRIWISGMIDKTQQIFLRRVLTWRQVTQVRVKIWMRKLGQACVVQQVRLSFIARLYLFTSAKPEAFIHVHIHFTEDLTTTCTNTHQYTQLISTLSISWPLCLLCCWLHNYWFLKSQSHWKLYQYIASI